MKDPLYMQLSSNAGLDRQVIDRSGKAITACQFSMLRQCKGTDLSRDAAGPPDRLPFSAAAPAAVLQAIATDMPAIAT